MSENVFSLIDHLVEYRILGGQFSLSTLQIVFCIMVSIAIIEEFAIAPLREDFFIIAFIIFPLTLGFCMLPQYIYYSYLSWV